MKMFQYNYNCVEVIGVRLFNPQLGDSVKRLFQDMSTCRSLQDGGKVVELALYCHAGIDSDWELIIYRNSIGGKPGKSELGYHLTTALSAFGLVHHDVWCREDNLIINLKQKIMTGETYERKEI